MKNKLDKKQLKLLVKFLKVFMNSNRKKQIEIIEGFENKIKKECD